jgi:CHAT domain-containing protein
MRNLTLATLGVAVFVLVVGLANLPSGFAQASARNAARLEATKASNEASAFFRAGKFIEAETLFAQALIVMEAAFGAGHPAIVPMLSNLAMASDARGLYDRAEALLRRGIEIYERARGPEHPDVGEATQLLAMFYAGHRRFAEAEPLFRRVLTIEQKAGASVGETARRLAATYAAQYRYAQAQEAERLSLEAYEKEGRSEGAEVASSLTRLADYYYSDGKYVEAKPLLVRALAIRERATGAEHPDLWPTLNLLGLVHKLLGELVEAQSVYVRGLKVLERAFGSDHEDIGTAANNLASLYLSRGMYSEAEQMARRAVASHEKWKGANHPDTMSALSNLGAWHFTLKQFGEDETLLVKALASLEKAFGASDRRVARVLQNLAELHKARKQYDLAVPLYRRALAILETEHGAEHPDVATIVSNLAEAHDLQGQFGPAESLHRRAAATSERVKGPEHLDTALALAKWADSYFRRGRGAPAISLYRRALTVHERVLGSNHKEVVVLLNNLANVYRSQGDFAAARPLYERARKLQIEVVSVNVDLDDDGLHGLGPAVLDLRHYAELLAAIVRDPARDPKATTPIAEAFLAAEQARAQSTQRALARAAARVAAGDSQTTNLARQVQELRYRREAARKQLVAEYGRPTERWDATRIASMRQTSEGLDHDLTAAAARLRVAFPRYGELASPEPVDVTAAQRLLRDDEALVSLFTLDDRVLVWLLRLGRSTVYRDIEVKRKDLTDLMTRVRTSLDQSLNGGLSTGQLAPFDVAAAHALYQLLLAPVAAEFVGAKHLLVVPDDVLLSVPFGVLVTTEGEAHHRLAEQAAQRRAPGPPEFADYVKLSWLARDYAISVLPSATSLRILRQSARARGTDAEPFVGFGDPVLQGRGQHRGGPMVVARSSAAVNALRDLPPLPATRDELLALANALGADPARALYLGARATKPELMALNGSGRLGRARVLSFATHGLLAGEIVGLRQPALVLTPPQQATDQDDGLLSLDDIVGLKLTDTDWVVLSACNTGAGDGSGEALSGLARAFFFAGAPTLLVSHWSVDDRATQALMTQIFKRYANDRSLSRAEALRQGMLALMVQAQGPSAYFAHPFAWAAFSVVGEGR